MHFFILQLLPLQQVQLLLPEAHLPVLLALLLLSGFLETLLNVLGASAFSSDCARSYTNLCYGLRQLRKFVPRVVVSIGDGVAVSLAAGMDESVFSVGVHLMRMMNGNPLFRLVLQSLPLHLPFVQSLPSFCVFLLCLNKEE